MWLLVPKQEFQHLAVEFVPFVTFVLYIAAVAVKYSERAVEVPQ